ncbi:MAG: M23 family metallopeptidase [Gemmatimonadetes bacterium]|nr:M23 family metallopeptidase [Gemmatimonadota bacterium]
MFGRRPRATLVLLALAAAGLWTALRAGENPPLAAPILVTAPFRDVADTLRRNETLSHLFRRHAIEGAELYAVLSAAPSLQPRRAPAGQVFEFRYRGREPQPVRVRTRLGAEAMLRLRRSPGAAWRGEVERINWSPVPVRAVGAVRSSIYQTLWDLIPDSVLSGAERDRMIYDLTDGVFGWQIDFTRDLAEGDRFQILFERLTSDLGEARYGRLLAARLDTRGRHHTAFVLSDDDGRNAYYDEQGRSLRRAFKLAPVSYRITSRYSSSRFHPILRTWRAHLGVDYRAPTGSPVDATADGTVIRAGRWGGYGIMVGIRHVNGIETRYAHLSRIARGVRPGVRVAQGDVIGYAGMTGLASAPHVHYEFLKYGQHRNPRPADLGDGTPVPAARMAEFEAARYHYGRLLNHPTPRILALGPN